MLKGAMAILMGLMFIQIAVIDAYNTIKELYRQQEGRDES